MSLNLGWATPPEVAVGVTEAGGWGSQGSQPPIQGYSQSVVWGEEDGSPFILAMGGDLPWGFF